jgi:hypothetical protein
MDYSNDLRRINTTLLGIDLTACGYEALAFTTSGVKTPAVPAGTVYMEIRIESSVTTGIVGRYLNLGAVTAPSSTVGLAVSHMDFFDVAGQDAVNNLRIIQTQAGTHTAHIQYYKK